MLTQDGGSGRQPTFYSDRFVYEHWLGSALVASLLIECSAFPLTTVVLLLR